MFGSGAAEREAQARKEATHTPKIRTPKQTQAEMDRAAVEDRQKVEAMREQQARRDADRKDAEAAQQKAKTASYTDVRKIRKGLQEARETRDREARGVLEKPRETFQGRLARAVHERVSDSAHRAADAVTKPAPTRKVVRQEFRETARAMPPAEMGHAIGGRIQRPANPEPQVIYIPQQQAAIFQPRAQFYRQPDPWQGFNSVVMGVPMARRVAAGKKLYQESPINRFARLV